MVAGVDFGDAAFAASVRDGVARIEQLMDTELRSADELMTDALMHLFKAGGKRFRPLFTVLSAQIGPNPDAWQVTIAGAVIELVHLATLYHDDVMDEAQVRRGAPSANARWSNNVAILAGDYLFATASRLVSRLGPEAVRMIAETFAQLVTGQMRETRGAAEQRRSDRALPEGGVREDGLPDRRGGPVRRDVLRRRRRAGRAAAAGSAASSAPRSRSPTTSSTSTATRTSRASCPAPTCAKACTPCRCSTRCANPGPTRDRLRELLAGPDRRRRRSGRGADAAAGVAGHGQGQGDFGAVRRAGPR